jgi:hypothetical protein
MTQQIIETLLSFVLLQAILGFMSLWLITYLKVPHEKILKFQDMDNSEFDKIFETYYIPNLKNMFIILNLIAAILLTLL